MSYQIGQFRRAQLSIANYRTLLKYNITTVTNNNTNVAFLDTAISLTSGSVLDNKHSYYLQFTVKQKNSVQNFSLQLQNSNDSQTIEDYTVPAGTGSTTFDIVFTPNSTYNLIVFVLARTAEDYNIIENSQYGRIMDITVNENNIYLMTNIIDTLASTYGLTELIRIGIQGPTGLMMSINGEQIKVGKTGIYELNDINIKITYLGFALKENALNIDGYDNFILDFEY